MLSGTRVKSGLPVKAIRMSCMRCNAVEHVVVVLAVSHDNTFKHSSKGTAVLRLMIERSWYYNCSLGIFVYNHKLPEIHAVVSSSHAYFLPSCCFIIIPTFRDATVDAIPYTVISKPRLRCHAVKFHAPFPNTPFSHHTLSFHDYGNAKSKIFHARSLHKVSRRRTTLSLPL